MSFFRCDISPPYYFDVRNVPERLRGISFEYHSEKRVQKLKPPKSGLFKEARKMYNSSGAGRHEIALPL